MVIIRRTTMKEKETEELKFVAKNELVELLIKDIEREKTIYCDTHINKPNAIIMSNKLASMFREVFHNQNGTEIFGLKIIECLDFNVTQFMLLRIVNKN